MFKFKLNTHPNKINKKELCELALADKGNQLREGFFQQALCPDLTKGSSPDTNPKAARSQLSPQGLGCRHTANT